MKKILLVEDDQAITDIYQTLFKKEGFQIKVAASAQEVLNINKKIENGEEEAPDLILLDLILPDMNGMEILKEIKSKEATKNIKVFVLTNQEQKPESPGEIKPDKFIVKANITPTQLVETIKKAI